jgi:hypothetical protein
LGYVVGLADGATVGFAVGAAVGLAVGLLVGLLGGCFVGDEKEIKPVIYKSEIKNIIFFNSNNTRT